MASVITESKSMKWNKRSSYFKCIKKFRTRIDLNDAIRIAESSVIFPRLRAATETVSAVSTIRDIHTAVYVRIPASFLLCFMISPYVIK